MPKTDDEARERRRKNFAVRAIPSRDPDFDGEKTVYITYNGRQEYANSLAPHEARKLCDLLRSEFGFADDEANSRDAMVRALEYSRELARLIANSAAVAPSIANDATSTLARIDAALALAGVPQHG